MRDAGNITTWFADPEFIRDFLVGLNKRNHHILQVVVDLNGFVIAQVYVFTYEVNDFLVKQQGG